MEKQTFLHQLSETTLEKYDYSLVPEVFHHKEKITFICPVHGEFKQRYDIHDRYGCSQCSMDSQKRKKFEQFLIKAKEIHGDKYDYSKCIYTDALKSIEIICPKHGSFWTRTNTHLRAECARCFCEKIGREFKITKEVLTERFFNLYHDKYKYIFPDIINNCRDYVTVICPFHGEFEVRIDNHLSGKSCKKCNKIGIISQKLLDIDKEFYRNTTAYLYQVLLYKKKEKFYKIGITRNKELSIRFSGIPYKFTEIDLVEINLYDAYSIEQKVIQDVEKYIPKEYFTGYTECFKNKIDINKYINAIN